MVAKSYQSMTQVGEPYESAGKMYVVVRNEKTGTIRQVRWYSDYEYTKLYGEPPVEPVVKTQKEMLGFEKGYITIFKGNTYTYLEWFRASVCKYNKTFGWYCPSSENLPADIPVGIEPVEVTWELVGNDKGDLKAEHIVKSAIESLIYEPSVSEFQGETGSRLGLDITVVSVYRGGGYYGPYTTHYFEDASGNRYLWSTGSKSWEVGSEHHIKATVKEHKVIKNVKVTVLTRCMEVK